MKSSRTLTEKLRSLSPLDTNALARVAGGAASTSTSGTPEAGDDTIGDRGEVTLKVYVDVVY